MSLLKASYFGTLNEEMASNVELNLMLISDVMSAGVQFSDFADSGPKSSRAIKGAPLGSLFAQFCLHSLWFGNCNIRGICQ